MLHNQYTHQLMYYAELFEREPLMTLFPNRSQPKGIVVRIKNPETTGSEYVGLYSDLSDSVVALNEAISLVHGQCGKPLWWRNQSRRQRLSRVNPQRKLTISGKLRELYQRHNTTETTTEISVEELFGKTQVAESEKQNQETNNEKNQETPTPQQESTPQETQPQETPPQESSSVEKLSEEKNVTQESTQQQNIPPQSSTKQETLATILERALQNKR